MSTSNVVLRQGIVKLGSGRQSRPMNDDAPSYHGYRFPPLIISHAVWLYHRFCLSFRGAEDSWHNGASPCPTRRFGNGVGHSVLRTPGRSGAGEDGGPHRAHPDDAHSHCHSRFLSAPMGNLNRAVRGQLPLKTNRAATKLKAASIFAGILSLAFHLSYSGIRNSFLIWSSDFPSWTILPTRSTSNA